MSVRQDMSFDILPETSQKKTHQCAPRSPDVGRHCDYSRALDNHGRVGVPFLTWTVKTDNPSSMVGSSAHRRRQRGWTSQPLINAVGEGCPIPNARGRGVLVVHE
jgi:hypothetical protein